MGLKKILIVDDEEYFANLLKLNLEKTKKYEAMVATSGEEGIELVKMHAPDLILLDLKMPGMDGLATIKELKAVAPQIPVVMVTAVWNETERKLAFMAGTLDYITKPVDFEYLMRVLSAKL